jgi:HNH endonuclease
MALEGACHRWNGRHRKEDGRPMLGSNVYVYRLKYEERYGPIPDGMVAHHECGHSWCVNPDHIQVMLQGQHLHEHGLPGDQHQALKMHCPAGHPYDEKNTYRHKGERHCRACRQNAKARYRAKLKQGNTANV